jgi:para-aminobenzoate synthetase component 1
LATVRPCLVSCPLDIPAERLAPVIGSWPEPALLESGPGFGESGRWSILAAQPRLVFTARDRFWSMRKAGGQFEHGHGDPLAVLGRLLRTYRLADPGDEPDPEASPFQGGMIGYFGYDLAPSLERLPRKAPKTSRLPDLWMALYDTAVTVDHQTGTVELHAHDLLGEGAAACHHRIRQWRTALRRSRIESIARSRLGPLTSNFTLQRYLDAVNAALVYIASGDVYQVNLSQRFIARGQPVPLDLYLRLKEISPAPFAAFLQWGDLAVVSASPEWFYQTRGDRIITRPIKGTRPRGHSQAEDIRLSDELRASVKDRAELTMIVDLERNDLGRVCRYGSIHVDDPLSVESFAQVHHLVATIAGRLWHEHGPIDVVRAVFPGGSITGAPKIRAMEIIDELEPNCRSVYTGAIGYFSRSGSSAFNIAIRTLLVEGDQVSYQVGGGIVADSDPQAEYHETLHKGRGLRAVVEGAEAEAHAGEDGPC